MAILGVGLEVTLQLCNLAGKVARLAKHRLNITWLEEPARRLRSQDGVAKMTGSAVVIAPDEANLSQANSRLGSPGVDLEGLLIALLSPAEVAAPERAVAHSNEFLNAIGPRSSGLRG